MIINETEKRARIEDVQLCTWYKGRKTTARYETTAAAQQAFDLLQKNPACIALRLTCSVYVDDHFDETLIIDTWARR